MDSGASVAAILADLVGWLSSSFRRHFGRQEISSLRAEQQADTSCQVPEVEMENGDMTKTFAVMNVTSPLKEGHKVVFSLEESFVQTSAGARYRPVDPRSSGDRHLSSSGDGLKASEEEGGERFTQTAPMQPTPAMIDAYEVSHLP